MKKKIKIHDEEKPLLKRKKVTPEELDNWAIDGSKEK